jgi:hypothetical protein
MKHPDPEQITRDAQEELKRRFGSGKSTSRRRFKDRYDEIPRLVSSAQGLTEPPTPAPTPVSGSITLEDFFAYMPMHQYIFATSRDLWPVSSINARLPAIESIDPKTGKPKTITASTWLDQNRPVEQMTWAPGEPMLITGRLISEGGWVNHADCTVFNLYRAPTIALGDSHRAQPWLDHLNRIYPNDAKHIICWLAHRVQRPGDKVNHALVLDGAQGIGKDTLLEPVKHAVGPWNFHEVSPTHLLGRFNGFVKSVILRVSEARDLGDVNRYSFYDHIKIYTAAPPDVLRCDEKNLREYPVPNVCGVVITSNHKTDGIYLPADDRRHYVAWCDLTKEDFETDYWNNLYGWYEQEGYRNVAAYLAQVDLSGFDPKAPPPHTATFHAIVDANRAPEDAELADVLDRMGNPEATTLAQITAKASGEFETWIRERKNRRAIPHRFEQCGYVPVRNDAAKDGLWKIHEARQVIYAKSALPLRDRIRAARNLTSNQ